MNSKLRLLLECFRFSAKSFDKQALWFAGTTLTSLFLVMLVATTLGLGRLERKQSEMTAGVFLQASAHTVRGLLLAQNDTALQLFLSQLTRRKEVVHAALYSAADHPVATAHSAQYQPDGPYSRRIEAITYHSEPLGTLILDFDDHYFVQGSNALLLALLALCVLLVASGAGLFFLFAKEKQARLLQLLGKLNSVSKTDSMVGLGEDIFAVLADRVDLLARQKEEVSPIISEPAIPSGDSTELVVAIDLYHVLQLPAEQLPQTLASVCRRMEQAAKLCGGALIYSAEGNAYVSFFESADHPPDLLSAICYARLVELLLSGLSSLPQGGGKVECGLAIMKQTPPCTSHPAVIESPASRALLMARLGQGRLLLHSHGVQQAGTVWPVMMATEYGEDVVEVGRTPDSLQGQLLDQVALIEELLQEEEAATPTAAAADELFSDRKEGPF